MSFWAILKTEFYSERGWYLGWILGINIYILITLLIYPGEEALRDFTVLLQEEYFQAFLGDIGGENPSYSLWLALMLPFISLVYFIFAIMSGARVTLKSISENTGEIVHVFPVSRLKILFGRWLFAVMMSIVMFAVFFALIVIPIMGQSAELDRALWASGWGILFVTAIISLGVLISMFSGNTGKAQQVGLFITLAAYAGQILTRVQEDFSELDNYNILTWYTPENAILGNEIQIEIYLKITVVLISCLLISFGIFQYRDLVRDVPVWQHRLPTVPSSLKNNQFLKLLIWPFSKFWILPKYIFIRKSVKNSPYTFWVKPLEQKFPFTANFVYSERRVLMIVFWGILLIWPAQLLAIPDLDVLQSSITGFGNQPIMRLFTYGHDLTNAPVLWFLVTQAIGNHYFFFLPLTYYWIGKVISRDGETGTGEILGSIPVSPHKVLLQRLFAIFLETILIIFQMVLWLLISESITGKSYDTLWETIAVVAVIPLYIFLLTFLLSLSLILKGRGVKIARITLLTLFFTFMVGMIGEDLNHWYITLVFGLYDPVLIIQEANLLVNNAGILILSGLAAISTFLIFLLSPRYTWLYIADEDQVITNGSGVPISN